MAHATMMPSPKWMLVAVAGAVLGGLLVVLPQRPLHDEAIHFVQAQAFARGSWAVLPDLAIWPTTHLLIAGVLAVAGADSLLAARATIALSALLAILAFYAIVAHHDVRNAAMRTAQLVFLPVLLPYCVLVYTDVPALAALLWMLYAILERRPGVFYLAAVAAVALRQSNVVWLVPGLPNVELATALGAFLYAPLFGALFARVGWGGWSRRWWIAGAGIAVFVALTFSVEHRFNTAPNLIAPYLRNRLLFAITHAPVVRLLFAGWTAISALLFARFPFVPPLRRVKVPLYLVVALSLLPFELIEQRYYLPFYAFFSAMRAPLGDREERWQLAFAVALSAAVVYAALRLHVFL